MSYCENVIQNWSLKIAFRLLTRKQLESGQEQMAAQKAILFLLEKYYYFVLQKRYWSKKPAAFYKQ